MSHIIIPEGYQSLLGLYDTQKAIGLIKTIFQEKLCMALHLKRVTAPLFVMQGSGLNDRNRFWLFDNNSFISNYILRKASKANTRQITKYFITNRKQTYMRSNFHNGAGNI